MSTQLPAQAKTSSLAELRPESAGTQVAAIQAIAEVKGMIEVAKAFPRNKMQALEAIKNDCARPSLANVALYQYPRGGTNVTGPSIRMAEAIAQNWGNIQFGFRVLDEKDGVSDVEAVAWDMETNVRQTKRFKVRHERKAKGVLVKLDDPRDIYELVANQAARRVRSCILSIIPGDIIDEAVAICEETVKANFDVTPENIQAMMTKFEEYGVTKEMVEKKIGQHLSTITSGQMMNMSKIYNSLRDGMSKTADWFDLDAGKENDKTTTADLRKKGKKDETEQQTLSVDPNAIAKLDEGLK